MRSQGSRGLERGTVRAHLLGLTTLLVVGAGIVVGLFAAGVFRPPVALVPAASPSALPAAASPTASPAGEPSPNVETPGPTATVSPSSQATVAPTSAPIGISWSRTSYPGSEAVDGVNGSAAGWVALGGLEAWSSVDGQTWTPSTVDRDVYIPPGFEGLPPDTITMGLGDVTSYAGELISVGFWAGPSDDRRPIVWRSSDGSSWDQVQPKTDWGYVVNAVAASEARIVAAGSYFTPGSGSMWTSVDGALWAESTPAAGEASMLDVVGDADGFVSVGFRYPSEAGETPAVWLSADGEAWEDASQPPAGPGTMLLAVGRAANGTYAAIGAVREGDGWTFAAWSSSDGFSWEPAQAPSSSTDNLVINRRPAVSAAGDGLIAILPNGEYWLSGDGIHWTEGEPLPDADEASSLTAVASREDQVLLFGVTSEGEPLSWLGTVQATPS